MRAFLVKLDYGLRDLAYMELERRAATDAGLRRCDTNPSRMTISCYFEKFGYACTTEGTQVRLHVHKEENGMKVGAVCSKQANLWMIFSIVQDDASGDFVLTVVETITHRFGLYLHLNNDLLPSFKQRSECTLRHGDIIEGFFSKLPSFRIMFLLSDDSHVVEPQTSLLLSCPTLVLRNIMKCLTPFQVMQGVVPVLEVLSLNTNEDAWVKFLTRRGKTLTNLEMLSVETVTLGNSLLKASESGHVLFPKCRVVSLRCSLEKMYSANMGQTFPRMEKLYLNHAILPGVEYLVSNFSFHPDPFLLEFPDFVGPGVLSSLHTYQLPVKLDAAGWKLAQRMGILANLESLSMNGRIFNNLPPVDERIIFFPKLKSLWLEDASPIDAVCHLPLMPSLEHLWIRNVDEQASVVPTQQVLNSLQIFSESSKEWLANLKFVSADLWETYIPYSKMMNLECVALFFQHKAVPRNPESAFKELSFCSKLRGLILSVPEDLPLDTLGQLSQPFEFLAFPGTTADRALSVFRHLSHCKNSLEDLWIQVRNPKEIKRILRTVKAFKRLKNVVFLSNRLSRTDEALLRETMRKCLGTRSFLNQVTIFGETLMHEQRDSLFSSAFITRFYKDWLKHVPDELVQGELTVFEAISVILNTVDER
ncbi:unnamed protein product [Notodromas monacha]|uniref:Uncharacterized protein n=1 Tax=Notodromas monacha TaxID=399045 RepID=A0A7R9GIX5_9CRUS|nr:unnamed protein product [Notodromas monacha]CAG0924403.1 unnamed protein product [Notodromas monacha]